MFFRQIKLGPMENFSYIIGDSETKEVAVVDPGFEHEKLLKECEENNLKITKILLTHAHFDHITDLPALAEKTHAEIYIHEKETFQTKLKLTKIKNNEIIPLGKIKIKVIHTPGHSQGSVCFLLDDNKLLTGDTLFVGGIGRTDLPESNSEQMKNSLKKLSKLPDETEIYPGHDYGERKSSTIKWEKENNPFLGD
ncbi:MAG: MBL fold metallo-hydrolase [Nanoarchaeota archaeon]|nr:MBL fold metallo-hydrolase [Nanoarchaeota archaeon]MBU1103198.1 MBL fold metallo-hydrolase [Nanoarchaeota archaeon]